MYGIRQRALGTTDGTGAAANSAGDLYSADNALFGVGCESSDDADVCAVCTIFLTFWWELAQWLDSWLLDVLYNSDTHSSWNLAGIQNTQDDVIINLVMRLMFLVLPTFWLGAMTWAGVRVGVALNGALAG